MCVDVGLIEVKTNSAPLGNGALLLGMKVKFALE